MVCVLRRLLQAAAPDDPILTRVNFILTWLAMSGSDLVAAMAREPPPRLVPRPLRSSGEAGGACVGPPPPQRAGAGPL